MPCCGGNGGARGRSMAVAVRGNPGALAKNSSKDEMVLMEYTGGRAGTFTQAGKDSGQVYRFSNSPTHSQKYVLAGDAEYLISLPDFRIIEANEGQEPIKPADYQPMQPTPKVVRSQGPRAVTEEVTGGRGRARKDDLTVIKGISAKRAEAFQQIGIQTFEALGILKPDELAGVLKGVGEKTAKRWIEEARALV